MASRHGYHESLETPFPHTTVVLLVRDEGSRGGCVREWAFEDQNLKPTYSDLLKDPRWQKKRLEILSRDEFECRLCCSGDNELHIHHHRYLRGHKPWEYESEDLVSLCKDCHQKIEDLKVRLSRSITTKASLFTANYLLDILDGPDSVLMVGIMCSLWRRQDLLPHVAMILTELKPTEIKNLESEIAQRA